MEIHQISGAPAVILILGPGIRWLDINALKIQTLVLEYKCILISGSGGGYKESVSGMSAFVSGDYKFYEKLGSRCSMTVNDQQIQY